MKKGLIGLVLALAVGQLNAESIDSEGRKWITATDIERAEVIDIHNIDTALAQQLKEYVILDNDIHKCYFREMWDSSDDDLTILNKWWEEGGVGRHKFSLYGRIFYRLPYAKLPKQILDKMDNTSLRDEVSVPPLPYFYEKYKGETTIKTDKDCEKIIRYIEEDLMMNY